MKKINNVFRIIDMLIFPVFTFIGWFLGDPASFDFYLLTILTWADYSTAEAQELIQNLYFS